MERYRVATIEPAETVVMPQSKYSRKFFNPILDDFPKHILGRPVRIGDTLLDSSSVAPQNNIGSLADWAAEPFIANMLAMYALMRPTFSLQFLLRSSSTIYGGIMVGFHYGPRIAAFPFSNDRTRTMLSTSNSHVLPVGSSGNVTMEVPFVWPYDWISTTDPNLANFFTPWISPLGITTLEPGADSTVDVEVWLTCTDIELSGMKAQGGKATPWKAHSTAHTNLGMHVGVGGFATVAQAGMKVYEAASMAHNVLKYQRGVAQGEKNVENEAHPDTETAQNGFPLYNAAIGVKVSDYGDINSLAHQVQMPKLTEMSVHKPIDPAIYGDTPLHRLADIAGAGSLVHLSEAVTLGDGFTLVLDSSNFGVYHNYIMQYFRYFRGRPRFKIFLMTSPLLAIRAQIAYSQTSFTNQSSNANVPKMNLLVKGTEVINVEVPFITYYPVGNSTSTIGELQLTITQVAQGLTATGNASMWVAVFACMSPDTQYFSARAPLIDAYATPVAATSKNSAKPLKGMKAQSVRAMVHDPIDLSFASGPHEKTDLYDEVETVEQLMKRWQDRPVTYQSDGALTVQFQKRQNLTEWNAWSKWGDIADGMTALFTLYRGSRDFRYRHLAAAGTAGDIFVSMPPSAVTPAGRENDTGQGTQWFTNTTYHDGRQTAFLEFTAPFLALQMTDTTYPTVFGDTRPEPFNTNATDAGVISRAGPDYQVFVLNMVPQSLVDTAVPGLPP